MYLNKQSLLELDLLKKTVQQGIGGSFGIRFIEGSKHSIGKKNLFSRSCHTTKTTMAPVKKFPIPFAPISENDGGRSTSSSYKIRQ